MRLRLRLRLRLVYLRNTLSLVSTGELFCCTQLLHAIVPSFICREKVQREDSRRAGAGGQEDRRAGGRRQGGRSTK